MKGRIVDHSLNELGVHFDDETFDSDDVQLRLPERPKETIELELSLRIARLLFVECDGTASTDVTFLIVSYLKNDVASTIHARVDGEDDWVIRFVVDGSKSGRVRDGMLKLHDSFELVEFDSKGDVLLSKLDERLSNECVVPDEETQYSTSS